MCVYIMNYYPILLSNMYIFFPQEHHALHCLHYQIRHVSFNARKRMGPLLTLILSARLIISAITTLTHYIFAHIPVYLTKHQVFVTLGRMSIANFSLMLHMNLTRPASDQSAMCNAPNVVATVIQRIYLLELQFQILILIAQSIISACIGSMTVSSHDCNYHALQVK